MSATRSPRITRAMLRKALPVDVRDDISGDLDEMFARDSASLGAARARGIYYRKAASFIGRFLLERLRDSLRAAAGFRISMLDFRLGVRMLARYPGLTVVGGLAMAFAIAIGASAFAFISMMLWPTLPLPDGDRVMTVLTRNVAENQTSGTGVYEYRRLQTATTLTDVGAGRMLTRNITTPDAVTDAAFMSEVTANTFDLIRLPPVKGRALSPADEQPGAPAVAVISTRIWRARFASDPEVIGRSILVGELPTTVVGVMPEGMHFPSIQDVWIPLALPASAEPRKGSTLRVWARLAPGVTLARANAELETIGAQMAAETPKTHEHLRPQAQPFAGGAQTMDPLERMMLGSMNGLVALLLVLVSSNVALLMFARAATRESEILVRTALGASRARVIAQFFSEALVLGVIAAVIGLGIASRGIHWGLAVYDIAANEGVPLPFWYVPKLSAWSIAYAAGLTLLAAGIAGILPALKVTRGMQSRLRETSAGSGGLQFGGVWTVVIVVQIAMTVAFPVAAFFVERDASQIRIARERVPADQVLSARFDMDRDITQPQFDAAVRQIERELAGLPSVRSVAIADPLPLMFHNLEVIEVEGGGATVVEPDFPGTRVATAAVSPSYFTTFDAPALLGRTFTGADYSSGRAVTVVNQTFVTRVLGGRNPIGRRIRSLGLQYHQGEQPPSPWMEIVGVIHDLGTAHYPDRGAFYRPLQPGTTRTLYVAARARGDAALLASQLRRVALKTDASLRISDVKPLSRIPDGELEFIRFWFLMTVGVSVFAMGLSLTGIYAVMSFTVARRTREIGIRVALGSSRGRVVFAILRRPLIQVATGVFLGAFLIGILPALILSGITAKHVLIFVSYALVMFVICLLAVLVPTKRALAIDPISALKSE
jgi:putative ABC transport system permease protein